MFPRRMNPAFRSGRRRPSARPMAIFNGQVVPVPFSMNTTILGGPNGITITSLPYGGVSLRPLTPAEAQALEAQMQAEMQEMQLELQEDMQEMQEDLDEMQREMQEDMQEMQRQMQAAYGGAMMPVGPMGAVPTAPGGMPGGMPNPLGGASMGMNAGGQSGGAGA